MWNKAAAGETSFWWYAQNWISAVDKFFSTLITLIYVCHNWIIWSFWSQYNTLSRVGLFIIYKKRNTDLWLHTIQSCSLFAGMVALLNRSTNGSYNNLIVCTSTDKKDLFFQSTVSEKWVQSAGGRILFWKHLVMSLCSFLTPDETHLLGNARSQNRLLKDFSVCQSDAICMLKHEHAHGNPTVETVTHLMQILDPVLSVTCCTTIRWSMERRWRRPNEVSYSLEMSH